MKYHLPLLFSACLCAFTLARAESPEQFYDEANKAYQAGNFTAAIQKYEAILAAGNLSGEVFYNLGNAYYKNGNIAKAILNYERAMKLMPNDDDLRHNLQLANLNITDKIEPTPRLFVWDWWDGVKSAFSLNGITWLTYSFFTLTVLSAIVTILARSYAARRVGFIAGLVCVSALALSLVVFIGKLNADRDANAAIVTADITTVKNSPDAKSTDAFVLHSGVKVFITDKVNEWMKVRLADGKVGWMEQKAAEII
jgi:tetratricopeptide (TPR) repeat protein